MEKQKYVSEWERKEIVKALHYGVIKPIDNKIITQSLMIFLNILEEKVYILDIGCGNGRIILNFNEELNKEFDYYGLDCNKFLIDIGNEKFSMKNNIILEHCNVDNLRSFEKYKNRIVYFDSTFQMLENPLKTLRLVSDFSNIIIFNRLKIDNSLEIPQNKFYKHGGMENESNCWHFPKIFFQNFRNNEWEFQNFGEQFILIKRNYLSYKIEKRIKDENEIIKEQKLLVLKQIALQKEKEYKLLQDAAKVSEEEIEQELINNSMFS